MLIGEACLGARSKLNAGYTAWAVVAGLVLPSWRAFLIGLVVLIGLNL